ncbi:hypothetical protein M405DRAFT_879801 [Rhizopogon salebrosus TDB-379]|nr:hypothetical protein M405DRAFT_879801 [Rhizopogon salebrosus TDB-379]
MCPSSANLSPLLLASESDEVGARKWRCQGVVASYLEQGQRLENLMVSLAPAKFNGGNRSRNAKSKREFKKLSKNMGDMLDKEKGWYRRSRDSEASQNARLGIIKRMQFTRWLHRYHSKMKTSESYIGYTINDAVVTIPAYF